MQFLLVLIFPVFLLATQLEELIVHAKEHHTSLQSLQMKMSALEDDKKLSQNFADPVLSLQVSDIQFDDATNRSLEPMQFTALSYNQQIPFFGKRDAKREKVSAQVDEMHLNLDAMVAKLVKKIKITAYSIWQLEQTLKITNQYITLTKQNIKLFSAFSSSDSKSHMSIMSAEMSLSELKIKKSKLRSALISYYKYISYLSAKDVTKVTVNTNIFKPHNIAYYKNSQEQNLHLKAKRASHTVANKEVKIKELDYYSDPKLSVGYYHREKFEDYANVGISFSLPIHGSQDLHVQKSKKISLALHNEVKDFNNLLSSQIEKYHANLESDFTIHNIIQNQSMPQIEHMFDLSSSSIKSGDELFLYISLLEKKLALDEQNIGVVASFHKNKATLEELIGSAQ